MLSVNPMSNQTQSLSFQGGKDNLAQKGWSYAKTIWGKRPVKEVKSLKVKTPTKIETPKENMIDQSGITWVKTKIWGEVPVKDAKYVKVENGSTLMPKKTKRINKKQAEMIDLANLNARLMDPKYTAEDKAVMLRNYVEAKLANMNLFEKIKLFFKTLFTK